MKHEQAKAELKRVLMEQSSISTGKLRKIVMAMNISLQPGNPPASQEVAYLKREIRKRDKTIRRLKDEQKAQEAGK